MILKRVLMPMLLLGIIFGMSGIAHAQLSCTVSASAAPQNNIVTTTGHTEPIGDVTISCTPTGAGATNTTVLDINYGGTIANTTAFPVGKAVTLSTVGQFAGITTLALTPTGGSLTNNTARLTIGPIGSTTGGINSSMITVSNVLLSIASTGKVDGSSLTATVVPQLVATGISIQGGADTATTATTVKDGINSAGIAIGTPVVGGPCGGTVLCGGTASYAANGVVADGNFSVTVTENYPSMFREAAQFNGGFVFPASPGQDTQIKFQFAGIPSGVTLTGCTATGSGSPTISSPSVDATNPTLIVGFGAALDLGVIDSVTLYCTGINTALATLPLPSTAITVQATLAPTGSAGFSVGGPSNVNDQIPRFAQTLLPASGITVVNATSAVSELLIPYTLAGGGFNTGISISNTTTDPFGITGGGAVPQSGTITFRGWGVRTDTGAAVTFTYSTATGTVAGNNALSTGGILASGKTFAVLLQDMLVAAGITNCSPTVVCFQGYVFAETGFTNAHGVAFVADSSFGAGATKFSQASPVLVLPQPAPVPGSRPGFESLAQ